MICNKVFCVVSFIVIYCLHHSIADNNKVGVTSNPKTPWNSTVTDRLKHELLMHYDKFARPTQHYNTTIVTIGLNILHVELNEFKNTFTVHGWIRLMWKDEKLKWNSTDYEGLTTLHVADHEIWQPDVVPYNSAAGSTIDHYANTHCLVSEDGSVLWVPPAQFVVFCELNLRLWPFDTQMCHIKLGSWTYHGNAIDLKLDGTQADDDLIVHNSEWEIINISQERHETYYACCPEPYCDITFNVTIKRRSPTYKAVIITPAFAVISMTLLNFWLPPQAGEKILLNGCTAIIICMFLLYFSQKCPAMGDHTPLIVLFYSSSLYIISFCMIGSVVVLWIAKTQHHRPLPWVIKHALTGWLGRWLGLSNYIDQTSLSGRGDGNSRGESVVSAGEELRDQLQHGGHVGLSDHAEDASDEHHMLETLPNRYSTNLPHHYDWLLLAATIDRLSFVFYSFLFAILAMAYSL